MDLVTHRTHPWVGHAAVDRAGSRIGRVESVVVAADGTPAWAVVKAGLIGGTALVPLDGATVADGQLRADVEARRVSSSPSVAAGQGLAHEDEARLRAHYGLPGPRQVAGGVLADPAALAELAGDGWVVRSEEEVRLSTVPAPAEVVRLRKRVVTEDVQITVTLRREELVVERLPAGEAGLALDPVPDHPWGQGEAVIVLHEERAVVDRVVVPRERVRVGVQVVAEERVVPVEVRKEVVDLEQEPVPPG